MAGTKEMVIIKLIQLAAGRFWEQESAAAAWGILQSQAAIEMCAAPPHPAPYCRLSDY